MSNKSAPRKHKYWRLYKNDIPDPDDKFKTIHFELSNLFDIMDNNGFRIGSSRLTCILTNKNIPIDYFGDIPILRWECSDGISELRNYIAKNTGLLFDYVLCHIYPDGSSGIGYHNDKEALDTPVVSISLGASRKFRIRDFNATKGWDYEYVLDSGDLLIMQPGMHKIYKHSVPIEKRVKEPRINLTFRMFEKKIH